MWTELTELTGFRNEAGASPVGVFALGESDSHPRVPNVGVSLRLPPFEIRSILLILSNYLSTRLFGCEIKAVEQPAQQPQPEGDFARENDCGPGRPGEGSDPFQLC